MRIRFRHLTPLFAAGAAAAAIAVAPTASASSNPTNCYDKGGASHCQRTGHSAIHVEAPQRANQPFGFGNFGFGGPPVWALG